jgi:hypothetical protein
MYYCIDCDYTMTRDDFDAGKGRIMFSAGKGLKDGTFRCGVCDDRCDDPEGMFPNDESKEDEEGDVIQCGKCECKLINDGARNIWSPKEWDTIEDAVWTDDDAFCKKCFDELVEEDDSAEDEPECCVGCGKNGKFPENRDGDMMCEWCMSDEDESCSECENED